MNNSYFKVLKVINLIDKDKLVKITYFLFVILIFISLIEATVIGSIYPIIEYLYDQDSLIKYQEKTNHFLNIELNYENFPAYFFLFISSLFLFSAILQIISIFLVNKVKEEISFNLKNKLLNQYFHKKMNFYEKNKAGDLIQRLLIHPTYCGEIVWFSLAALKELMVMLVIYFFLLYLSIKYTLVLTIIFLILSIIVQKGKKLVISQTHQRNTSQEKLFSISNIIISAIKIIKISNKKKYFIDLFYKYSTNYRNKEVYLNTIVNLPAIVIRFSSFATLVMLVYYITSRTNFEPAFFGVYFAAAYKINNSFGLFNNSILGINNVLPSFDIIKKELSREIIKYKDKKKLIKIYNFKKQINLKKIVFNYQNSKNPTLNITNLKIKKGNIIGLVGDSGSGKSTLLDILSGLRVPNKILINIDGKKNINHENIYFNNFTYSNQKQIIFPGTIKQNITFFDKTENLKRINEVMNICELKALFKSKSLSLNSQIRENGNNLSGGQMQRIGLARTLYLENEIIFLDEALSNVESKTESEILSKVFKFVKKYNKTLIIVSHNLSFLKHVDQIINIKNITNYNKKNFN